MQNIDELPLPDRILKAAFITFAERGYDKTSMDEIAAVATTTKRTIYAHFGNKEALFRAAIARAIELFLSELPKLDPVGEPERELLNFATQFSELSTWRMAVLLQRVVIEVSAKLPDLGEKLHHDVIVAAEERLAEYLERRFLFPTQRPAEGPQAFGRLFLNMTTGPQRFATLMEARTPAPVHPFVRTSGTDDEWVRFAVGVFLAGLAQVATEDPGGQ